MAFWLYTSGSTGRPKGAVHLHHSFEVGPATFGRHILAMSENDRVFSTTKFYHAYGLGNSVSYPLHFGATAVVLDGPPSPERLIATLREHRPTIYFSVPALYRQLSATRTPTARWTPCGCASRRRSRCRCGPSSSGRSGSGWRSSTASARPRCG